MNLIRQSTARTLVIGPALDPSDGVTPVSGLAAGTVDEIGVYKHEATALTSISGTTTLTHRAGGIYTLTLSTSDTDTPGSLFVYLRDDSATLPIFERFTVVPANVYDSLVAGSDDLDVAVTEIAAAAADRVADHTLRRSFANAADSADGDTKSFRSLLGAVAKLVNRIAVSGSTLTIYEEDDSTSLGTQALTTNASLDPISEIDTN